MARGETKHQKGSSDLGQIRGHIEAVGGGHYHFCGVLQSVSTGGATVWGGDLGIVRGRVEVNSGGPHGFLRQVIRKLVKRRRDGTCRW